MLYFYDIIIANDFIKRVKCILTLRRFTAPLRTMLVIISALMLLFTVLSILLVVIFKSISEQDTNDFVKRTTEIYGASVDAKLKNYLTGIDAVALNNMLRDQMWNPYVSEMDMVSLGTQMQRNVDSITYSFYSSGDIYRHTIYSFLPTDGSYFFNLSRAEALPWYIEMQEKGASTMQWYSYSNITKSNHLNIAKIINRYGVVNNNQADGDCCQTISINLSNLLLPSAEMFPDTTVSLYLIDNKRKEIVYTNTENDDKQVMGYYSNKMRKNKDEMPTATAQFEFSKDKKSNIALYQLENLNMCIGIVFPQTDVLNSNTLTRNIVLWLFDVPVFLLLLFLLLFYRVFSSRLEHIVSNIDNFDERSQTDLKPLSGNDELARIDRHLTRMLVRIKTLIKDNYVQKMEKITAKLEALTTCINPHFLYNTLNTISAKACMDGADDTVAMINSLSAMFRYSSAAGDKLVPLRLEVENIGEYLSIQKERYQERLTIKVDIEDKFMEILVPKLTLQPVVENCFKHGFNLGLTSETVAKEIVIWGEKSENTLHLFVRDNGSGIPEHEVEKLRRMLAQNDTSQDTSDGRIGIQNVNNRIKLICGKDYGIEIVSEEGYFTRVELRFPLQETKCNDL